MLPKIRNIKHFASCLLKEYVSNIENQNSQSSNKKQNDKSIIPSNFSTIGASKKQLQREGKNEITKAIIPTQTPHGRCSPAGQTTKQFQVESSVEYANETRDSAYEIASHPSSSTETLA
ncbi:hypothetical protein ABFX02_07G069500 [Erythranthe guttata]